MTCGGGFPLVFRQRRLPDRCEAGSLDDGSGAGAFPKFRRRQFKGCLAAHARDFQDDPKARASGFRGRIGLP